MVRSRRVSGTPLSAARSRASVIPNGPSVSMLAPVAATCSPIRFLAPSRITLARGPSSNQESTYAYSAHVAAPTILRQRPYTTYYSARAGPDARSVLRHRNQPRYGRVDGPDSRDTRRRPHWPSGRGGVGRPGMHRRPDRYPHRLCRRLCRTRDRLAPSSFRGAPPGRSSQAAHTVTVSGQTFQMSSQYSAMARSDENLPLRAVFRIDIFVHASLSSHAALTCSWQLT
jgi:hypothetical protein